MHSPDRPLRSGRRGVTRTTHGTEHGLEVAVVERDRGGLVHARAVRRLDAPERNWVTIQYRRAEADPARGLAASSTRARCRS